MHADVDPEVVVFAREVGRQHRRLQQLMRDVLESGDGTCAGAWQELRRYLAAHEAAERMAMHPLFRARDRDDLSVLERVAEEDEIALAMAALDGVDGFDPAADGGFREAVGTTAGDGFRGAVVDLCALVSAHTDREERDELVGFLHRITDDDAAELVEVLTLVEVAGAALPATGATFAELLVLAETEIDRLLVASRGRGPTAH